MTTENSKEESFLYGESRFDRDKEYWNNYYATIEEKLNTPSQFAGFVSNYLVSGKHLLELGCGNGRDSFHFLELGLNVTGIDASNYIIDKLNCIALHIDNASFVCGDFVKYIPAFEEKYDYVYSRFTMHAISGFQETELLNNIRTYLIREGLFLVEARPVHDELFGKGKQINKNAYIFNGHYRRFIDAVEFRTKLEKIGFEIIFFEERTGFSKTNDSDPILLRCVARLK